MQRHALVRLGRVRALLLDDLVDFYSDEDELVSAAAPVQLASRASRRVPRAPRARHAAAAAALRRAAPHARTPARAPLRSLPRVAPPRLQLQTVRQRLLHWHSTHTSTYEYLFTRIPLTTRIFKRFGREFGPRNACLGCGTLVSGPTGRRTEKIANKLAGMHAVNYSYGWDE